LICQCIRWMHTHMTHDTCSIKWIIKWRACLDTS
jgi:hypothetical protein